jgi:hypothetical protein
MFTFFREDGAGLAGVEDGDGGVGSKSIFTLPLN